MSSAEPTKPEAMAEDEEDMEAVKRLDKASFVLSIGVFLHLVAMTLTWGARDNIALVRTGSAAKAATFLARIDGIGALMELLLNPIVGKLSDAWGRRKFIANASVGTCVLSAFVAKQGNLFSLFLDKFITTPWTTSYFTVFRAALIDLVSKTKGTGDFATRSAQIGGFAGLALIAGPMIGGKIKARFGDQAAFFASSLVALANVAYLHKSFEETLPLQDRCELTRKSVVQDMQPFSFTQVWGLSPALSKMFLAEGFQTLAETRNLAPVQYLLLTQDFKWNMNMFAKALAGFGISLMGGGIMAKEQLEFLGLRLFTTVCNVCNSAALLSMGCGALIEKATGITTPYSWALGILLFIPGARKRDGIEGVMMLLGDEAGFGRGFMSGAMMNWRAIFNTITPLFLGYLYAWGKSNGRNAPYLPWVVGSISNLVAEGFLQTISNKELLLDDKGNMIETTSEQNKD